MGIISIYFAVAISILLFLKVWLVVSILHVCVWEHQTRHKVLLLNNIKKPFLFHWSLLLSRQDWFMFLLSAKMNFLSLPYFFNFGLVSLISFSCFLPYLEIILEKSLYFLISIYNPGDMLRLFILMFYQIFLSPQVK